MNHIEAVAVAFFVIGVYAAWRVARTFERFRRARADLHRTIDTIKGLIGRVRAEGMLLVKYGGISLLVVGALVVAAIAKGNS